MANMVTSIVMQLVDRVTSPVRRIQQALSGMTARSGLGGLGRSARQVGVQLGHVTRQAGALAKRMTMLGALVGAGSLFGLARMVPAMTKASDEIRLSAQRLGVGTTALQEWMHVARQFGVDNGMLVRSMQTLQVNTDEFIMTAKGPGADAFKRLGIDYKQIRQTKGNADKLFSLVTDKLRDVKNDAERQNIAQALFGGGARQLAGLAAASKKEIEAMKAAAHETGGVLTPEQIEQAKRYNEGMDDLGVRLAGIRDTVVSGLLPAINGWTERMNRLVGQNKALIATRVEEWLRSVLGVLRTVGRVVSWVAGLVGGFGNLLGWIAGIIAGKFLLSLALATISIAKLGWELGKLLAKGLIGLGRGLITATGQLVAFAARGVAVAATSLVSLSRGLIGLAARAVPAAIMGIRAMSVALLTTPVGWIIAGITAVAGIAYLLYKNWDGVAAWFGRLWEGVKKFFSQSPAEIAKQLVAFSPAGLVYRHWDGITAWFGKMWEGVKKFFVQGVGEVAKQLLGFNPAELLGQGIDAVFGMFETKSLTETGTKWISGLWDGIKARWSQLTSWLRSSVADLTSWMPDWAKDRLGIGSMAAPVAGGSPQAALGAPVATPGMVPGMAAQRSQVDVGGQLKIQIDSEGRARVKEARSRGGMGFDVDAGVMGLAQ